MWSVSLTGVGSKQTSRPLYENASFETKLEEDASQSNYQELIKGEPRLVKALEAFTRNNWMVNAYGTVCRPNSDL